MRKKEIEESKYLGGDMEHTHLVKGLDYSLLHKIRSELEKEKRMEAYVPHLNPHIAVAADVCMYIQGGGGSRRGDQGGSSTSQAGVPHASGAERAPSPL
jgi:hypothetical protein